LTSLPRHRPVHSKSIRSRAIGSPTVITTFYCVVGWVATLSGDSVAAVHNFSLSRSLHIWCRILSVCHRSGLAVSRAHVHPRGHIRLTMYTVCVGPCTVSSLFIAGPPLSRPSSLLRGSFFVCDSSRIGCKLSVAVILNGVSFLPGRSVGPAGSILYVLSVKSTR